MGERAECFQRCTNANRIGQILPHTCHDANDRSYRYAGVFCGGEIQLLEPSCSVDSEISSIETFAPHAFEDEHRWTKIVVSGPLTPDFGQRLLPFLGWIEPDARSCACCHVWIVNNPGDKRLATKLTAGQLLMNSSTIGNNSLRVHLLFTQ